MSAEGDKHLLWPLATTRVAAVIGHPVRHSLSPLLHNAAFRALGLDWAYVAFDVAEGEVPAAVAGMRALGIAGMSVTMPHKEAAASSADVLTPDAERLQAVNALALDGGRVVGHNTDVAGFVDTLRADEGFDPAGKRCVVVGAGGAGRAVVLGLADAGAGEVVVVNRTPERALAAAALAGGAGRAGSIHEVAGADLVVNATPMGMAGTPAAEAAAGSSVPFELLHPAQLVVDLVYEPPVTPLVAAARARGAAACNGLGMLVHQAAHAFRIWTSTEPPLEVMSAAALAFLARERRDTGAAGSGAPTLLRRRQPD